MPTLTTQVVGAYGEKVVAAELLRHEWIAADVNATIYNSANYDIFALKNGRTVQIRVKTCGPEVREFQFGSKKQEQIKWRGFSDTDFTILVSMGLTRNDDEIYVIPTGEVRKALSIHREHYLAQPKRDGTQRVDNGQWNLRLFDKRAEDGDPSYGLAQKWARYREAWVILESPAKQPS